MEAVMSISISATVGRFGVNRMNDVAEIQQLLNNVPITQGGPVIPIRVNGFCGEQTKSAIKDFQLFHFGVDEADGRVDPNSRSCALLAKFHCPTRQTKPEPPVTEFHIRASAKDRFYEVRPASGASTAVYWIGMPPAPVQPLLWFEGTEIPFRATGDLTVDSLECRATYTTRAARGKVTSELTLNLPSGVIRIPMSAHLPTPSHTAVATLAGIFKKVA
jgi:peptidoglycan hydrolase-like protein with peptidoglycan-binding domain